MSLSISLYKYSKDTANVGNLIQESVTDISALLIDDEVSIDKRLEFSGAFDFAVSSSSLRFIHSSTLETEFTNTNLDTYVYGIKILSGETVVFWGFVDAESVDYDYNTREFSLVGVDWYKYFLNVFETVYCQPYTGTLYDDIYFLVSEWLESVFQNITLVTGVNVLIPEGDYSFIARIFNARYVQICAITTISDMLRNIQKYFGAYIYVDESGVLQVINREISLTGDAVAIDNNIFEDSYAVQYYQKPQYDSIVVAKPSLVNLIEETNTDKYIYYIDNSDEASEDDEDGWSPSIVGLHRRPFNESNSQRFNFLDLVLKLPIPSAAIYSGHLASVGTEYEIFNPSPSAGLSLVNKLAKVKIANNPVYAYGRVTKFIKTPTSNPTYFAIKVEYFVDSDNTESPQVGDEIYIADYSNTDTGFTLFGYRGATESLMDYRSVLVPNQILKCKVNRTDLNLNKKVSVNSVEYYVYNAKIINEDYSELELFMIRDF